MRRKKEEVVKAYDLDIVIPVYNERRNIIKVLDALNQSVKTSFRVLICYDHDYDNTLPVVSEYKPTHFDILLVKNQGQAVHGAIVTGFKTSTAPAVLVFPADDDYNAGIIDQMYEKFSQGFDIVAASRFIKGGRMVGAPVLKSILARAASFTLFWLASIPIRDASNGFRLFSRRIIDDIAIESDRGFTYSLELLVKCHRLGWKIAEVPALWFERTSGKSRFRISQWLPHYIRWYLYGFSTKYLRRPPESVRKSR